LNPSTLACELCSNFGGSYKPIDKPGKWVHALCYAWIPEIYFNGSAYGSDAFLVTSKLDKKRFKLKCALCRGSKKGAGIQCSYGRCTTAAHPW
jgi:hypothetical protein